MTIKRPAQRRVEQRADRFVRAFEQRIAGIDVDRSDHRRRAAAAAGFASRGHQLIEQLADAAHARGARPALQPGDVVGLERDRDRLLRHTIFIRYSLIIAYVKMYSKRRERCRHRPGSTRRHRRNRALDLFLIFVGANVVATTFQVGASLASSFTRARVDAVDPGRQRGRRGARRGARADWLAAARALGDCRAPGARHPRCRSSSRRSCTDPTSPGSRSTT